MGRCLALAALGESPPGQPVISVPDPEYENLVESLRNQGMQFYYETIPDADESSPIRAWILGGTSVSLGDRPLSGLGDDDDEDEEFMDAEEGEDS